MRLWVFLPPNSELHCYCSTRHNVCTRTFLKYFFFKVGVFIIFSSILIKWLWTVVGISHNSLEQLCAFYSFKNIVNMARCFKVWTGLLRSTSKDITDTFLSLCFEPGLCFCSVGPWTSLCCWRSAALEPQLWVSHCCPLQILEEIR